MVAWLFLILLVAAGGTLLVRPDRFAFRGSTLLGFLLLSLGMTSPLALHPTRMMLASGAGPDAFIGVWNLWWTRAALALGVNPLETGWLFHPNGTSLALHTFAFTYGLASVPLQWLAGWVIPESADAAHAPAALFLAYNLILVLSFTLSGYFTYRLALLETGHRTAALLAGLLFAFTNYRFGNTVRLHVLATELLVLALWAWTALLRRPSPVRLLLWAGSMVMLIYGSLEYALYAPLAFLILAIPRLRAALLRGRAQTAKPSDVPLGRRREPQAVRPQSPPQNPARPRAVWLACGTGALFGSVLLLLPLLVQLGPRLREGGTHFNPSLAVFFSADLLDFFLPNPRHPFYGSLFAPITASFHQGNGGFSLSLGWVALGLFAVSAWILVRSRQGSVWFWGFLFFWVLSLGPVLHFGGHILDGFPMPQALLVKIAPFLGGSRTPIRFMAPSGLFLALTVACGWSALRHKQGFEKAQAPSLLEAVLGGLLLFESLAAPLPLAAIPIPAVYGEIRGAPGAWALLHVPSMTARENLLYQTVHRQRLVEDVSSAVPLRSRKGPDPFSDPRWSLLEESLGTPGWIRSLPDFRRVQALEALRGFLQQVQIRWVVLDRSREALAADAVGFVQDPVMDEGTYMAFRENLRQLGPVRETEAGDATLFEYPVGPIGR